MATKSKKPRDLVTPEPDPETPPDESPAVVPDESPAPGAPVVEPAATIEDVIQLEPAPEAPNVAAAVAALDAPAAGPPAPDGSTPAAVVPVKDPTRWSENRIKRASRAELKKRVQQLQDAPPPAPAMTAEVQTPVAPEEVTQLVRQVLPAVDAVLVFAVGKQLAAKPQELDLLAKTYTPALLPHYEQLKAKLPWIPAVGATLGVYVPKVVERLQEVRREKAAKQDAGPAPAPDVSPIVIDPQQELPQPATATAGDQFTQPYGGPHE
jgi:hypothetical protein